MGKVRTTLTIEEDVLKEAKEKIPNLSKTVEETLKVHLASQNNDELQIRQEIQLKQQQMIEIQTQLGILESKLNNVTITKQNNTQLQNNIWRIVLNEYRDEGSLIDRDINEATKKLSINEDMLMKTVENVVFDLKHQDANIMDVRNWAFVEKHYLNREDV